MNITKLLVLLLCTFNVSVVSAAPKGNGGGNSGGSNSTPIIQQIVQDLTGGITIIGDGYADSDVVKVAGDIVTFQFIDPKTLYITAANLSITEATTVKIAVNDVVEAFAFINGDITAEPPVTPSACSCTGAWTDYLTTNVNETTTLQELIDSGSGVCQSVIEGSYTGTVSVEEIQSDYPEFYTFGVVDDGTGMACNLITFEGVNLLGIIYPDYNNSSVLINNSITELSEFEGCKNKIKEIICP